MPSLSLGGGLGGGGEKAAPPSRGGPSFPRTVGYLAEGLAHVRVTDCTVASGHTTVLTEEGHVYSFGPTAPGHVHPTAAQQSAAAAALQPVQRPRRLMHLAQVARVFSNEQYVVVAVAVTRPSPLPSFPELEGVFEAAGAGERQRKPMLSAVEVPPLRLLCEFHLSQQITPLTVVAAYQWSFNTASPNLLRYCTRYLLGNLALYGVPLDEITRYTAKVDAVTAPEVQAFAARVLDPRGASVIVAGDAKAFTAGLKAKAPGLEVIPAADLDFDNPSLRKR